MSVSLIEELKTIRDFRAGKGRRYPLWLILLLIVMGTMSGCQGYAALEDFGVRHYPVLCDALELNLKTKRLPSDSTFRRILERLNFQVLNAHFERWALQYTDINANDWMSLDGKSIKGTVVGGGTEYQNFVTLVSLYAHSQETVLAAEQFETHQTNEIKAVQTLLERLHLTSVVFTLDAIHAQKKTTEQIIEGGNDYVITLKANQPTLYQQAQLTVEQAIQADDYDQFIDIDTSRNRYVCWMVKVVKDLTDIDLDWQGLSSIIEVTRCGLRDGNLFHEVHYYISSLQATAESLAQGIRGHWGIENLVHWVKDVVMGEDQAPFTAFNAATNWSIIRNMVINIARHNGYHSLTKARRFLAHDIPTILSFLK